MFDEQNGRAALVADPSDMIHEPVHIRRGETGGGLVEQE
jgi:hypothetical protein